MLLLCFFTGGALLCVQRYRGNRAELCFVYSVTVETELVYSVTVETERKLCFVYSVTVETELVYSVTVETERSSALCTVLPWKPSGALLCVQCYRGNRACVQRYRGNRAELCFVYSVTVETERKLCFVYSVTVETELVYSVTVETSLSPTAPPAGT